MTELDIKNDFAVIVAALAEPSPSPEAIAAIGRQVGQLVINVNRIADALEQIALNTQPRSI